MKLSLAGQQGLSYKTASRLWKAGKAGPARRAIGHGHGDSPRRASQRAAGGGLICQSFLPGPESGLGSATGPFGGVLRPPTTTVLWQLGVFGFRLFQNWDVRVRVFP